MYTQAGAWIGLSTSYLPAARFKIQGFDSHGAANVWGFIADFSDSNYGSYSIYIKIPVGSSYTKLKFIFYSGPDLGGNPTVSLSELIFIHPEATSPLSCYLYWQSSRKSG